MTDEDFECHAARVLVTLWELMARSYSYPSCFEVSHEVTFSSGISQATNENCGRAFMRGGERGGHPRSFASSDSPFAACGLGVNSRT